MPRPKSRVVDRERIGSIGEIITWRPHAVAFYVFCTYPGPKPTSYLSPVKRLRLGPLHALPKTICEAFEKSEIKQTQMERALDLVFAELNKRLHRA